MTPIFKKHGAAIIWVFTAIATVFSAYLLKGTELENAWLYIFAAGCVLAAAFESYSKTKD